MQWIARANRTHLTIALVGIFAFASTFAFLQSLDKKIAVAQLSRPIATGDVITSNDFNYVEVSYDQLIAKNIVTKDSFENNKLVARTDLSSSDLLTKSNTIRRSTNSGLQSLSIGVDSDRANGGDIYKKDLVNIWRTGEDSLLIAKSVPVRDVIQPNKRLGISTAKSITIVLAVTSKQARDLSAIIGSTDIMVVISTGSSDESAENDLYATDPSSPKDQGHFENLSTSENIKNEGD